MWIKSLFEEVRHVAKDKIIEVVLIWFAHFCWSKSKPLFHGVSLFFIIVYSGILSWLDDIKVISLSPQRKGQIMLLFVILFVVSVIEKRTQKIANAIP